MAEPLVTNCTCKIYEETITYKGESTLTLKDTVDGWFEEGNALVYRREVPGLVSIGAAELFLWDDVVVNGRKIEIGGKNYEVVSWHRYTEPDDNSFNHLEMILK